MRVYFHKIDDWFDSFKLKKNAKLQDIIQEDGLNHQSKHGKTYNFGKYSLPNVFFRGINEGYLSLENADLNQINFANELKNFEEGIKILGKRSFLNEKVLNKFKSRLFWIKNLDKISTHVPTPERATEPEVTNEPTKAKKEEAKRKTFSLKCS